MASATLVGNDIQVGNQMVARLDETSLRPKVALWMKIPDYEDGRLVLAAPEYDRQQQRKAYEAIGQVFIENRTYGRPAILILRMRDPFIKALRERFKDSADSEGMMLGGHFIGDRFIEDAYVYRIT